MPLDLWTLSSAPGSLDIGYYLVPLNPWTLSSAPGPLDIVYYLVPLNPWTLPRTPGPLDIIYYLVPLDPWTLSRTPGHYTEFPWTLYRLSTKSMVKAQGVHLVKVQGVQGNGPWNSGSPGNPLTFYSTLTNHSHAQP